MAIEVDLQDIRETSSYASRYALGIPRFKRERAYRGPRDADTLNRLKLLDEKVH